MILEERFRPTPGQYVMITRIAVGALAAIIVTGAAVRLTGSGLGCSDWPVCEKNRLVAALEFHPMIEFVNRLITGIVSVAVIVAVLGSLRRRPRRRDLTRWSTVLVVGVVAQILIGAVVTLSKLEYSVVAIHFLVSMGLVWAACVLVDLAGRPDGMAQVPRRWMRETRVIVGLATAVLVSGALVTSAGPHPGALPDGAGVEHAVRRLPIDFTSIVRIHSILVWCLCAVVVVTAARIATGRLSGVGPTGTRALQELLVAVLAQGAIGYIQYFTGVPALLVAVHVAGATLVWIMALRLAFATATLDTDEAGADEAHTAGTGAEASPALPVGVAP